MEAYIFFITRTFQFISLALLIYEVGRKPNQENGLF
jgi:hypothetical protein